MLGEPGQRILGEITVVVIGCGGIGSIVVELLARLGVGHIVIDDDIVEPTNLPRIVGSTRRDAMERLTRHGRPSWMQRVGRRLARRKVDVARRIALAANSNRRVETILGNLAEESIARRLTGSDYMFLAADSFRARLLVNAMAFQYGIPAVQLGAEVRTNKADGTITDVYSVVRPFGPERGCLWCNGLIPPGRLADEGLTAHQRNAQQYIEDAEVVVPSVITLNAVAASHAVNEFMFHVTGLSRRHEGIRYAEFRPSEGEVERTNPSRDPECPECGDSPSSRRSRGDGRPLPTRHGAR